MLDRADTDANADDQSGLSGAIPEDDALFVLEE